MDSFFPCLLEPQWEALCSGFRRVALRLHFVFIFRPQFMFTRCLVPRFFWKKARSQSRSFHWGPGFRLPEMIISH